MPNRKKIVILYFGKAYNKNEKNIAATKQEKLQFRILFKPEKMKPDICISLFVDNMFIFSILSFLINLIMSCFLVFAFFENEFVSSYYFYKNTYYIGIRIRA